MDKRLQQIREIEERMLRDMMRVGLSKQAAVDFIVAVTAPKGYEIIEISDTEFISRPIR